MTAALRARAQRAFCCTEARARGLDPIGYAFPYDYFLLIETPLPWPGSVAKTDLLPRAVAALRQELVVDRFPDRWIKLLVLLVAPQANTPAGMRRVLFLRRPAAPTADVLAAAEAAGGLSPAEEPPFRDFVKQEYLVPEADTGTLCWALLRDPLALEHFRDHRQNTEHVRELLVCTHGAVDVACAKFGGDLFRRLQRMPEMAAGLVRPWRCSHFGGHVFAPTLLELPNGRFWAYVEEEAIDAIVRQQGDVARLRDRYRGWSGHRSVWARVLERQGLLDEGWRWLGFDQTSTVLREGPPKSGDDGHLAQPAWGEVTLDFRDPATGRSGAYTARVEQVESIFTPHSTGKPEPYQYPQYRVAWWRRAD
jgi:hypothetical protein